MEMSVAMKKTLILLVLLVVFPTLTAAQTQTRERRSDDSEKPPGNDSAAVRNRVVGPRVANHVEKQKSVPPDQGGSVSTSNVDSRANPKNQDATQPSWGNTAIVIRSRPNERIAPVDGSPVTKPAPVDQDTRTAKKTVQLTALLTESPGTQAAPIRANASSRTSSSLRPSASTSLYKVDIGDVLDVRLANMPTRESTLFTVLKNGVLEYPLLNGPISVAGLTTDEIAKLLSNEIKVIKTARVSVSVRDYASHAVVITGLVDSPGRKTLRREAMPLYTVLAEALPRPEALLATIVRAGKEQALSLNDEVAMSTLVVPGDVIKITGSNATAKRFVYVGGEVASPGEKEFREGMTLTQALLSAGGVSRNNKTVVKVARRNASGFLIAREYNLSAIEEGKSQDPSLEAGDRIEVTRGM
jgi:protein involved in polysaccharide export with SLBB domain